ncbi:MAG: ABC transporter ATP-binding protein [Saprospiraceae bacterium]|nr:ABC transporter ATP-binding protein [Saprospiraceae bacterium]
MIQAIDLSFGYRNDQTILNHLDFQLPSGTITGLLGKNGVGKTSLLRMMAGLVYPTIGSIHVTEYTPQHRLPDFLKDIYFVPEDFYVPDLTIEKYISVFGTYYPQFNYDKCDELIQSQELKLSNKLGKLSTGQRKKFIIAFALSTGCKALLFDEPTNGLDISSKSEFRKIVASSISDNQQIIIATHQVNDISLLIDRLMIIDNSKIRLNASLLDISQQYLFEEVAELNNPQIIFSEPTWNGFKAIIAKENQGSTVDVEILFKAVIAGKFSYSDKNIITQTQIL